MTGNSSNQGGSSGTSGFARSAMNGGGSGNSMPPPKDRPALVKRLESILTIDGQGRPAKARMLLELLISDIPDEMLMGAIMEIGDRKWF